MAYPAAMQAPVSLNLARAMIMSLAIHAAVLQVLGGLPGGSGGHARAGPPRQPMTVVTLAVARPPLPASPSTTDQNAAIMQQAGGEPAPPADPPPPASPGTSDDPSALSATAGMGMAYWPAALLDERPGVLLDIPADLVELKQFPDGGTMTLILKIGASGRVDAVEPQSSSLPDAFVAHTARAFYAAKFAPGKKNGVPVGALLKIEVTFQPLVLTDPKGVISGTSSSTMAPAAP